jgi:hypothetical protein
MAKNQNKGSGAKKYGRNKRKRLQNSPLSLYVRNKIDFTAYARTCGIKCETK